MHLVMLNTPTQNHTCDLQTTPPTRLEKWSTNLALQTFPPSPPQATATHVNNFNSNETGDFNHYFLND